MVCEARLGGDQSYCLCFLFFIYFFVKRVWRSSKVTLGLVIDFRPTRLKVEGVKRLGRYIISSLTGVCDSNPGVGAGSRTSVFGGLSPWILGYLGAETESRLDRILKLN